MMAGVGAGVGICVNWTGVMAKGLGGGLSGIWDAGNLFTLGGNAGGVSVGTLREGEGQSVWSAPAGAGCSAFGVGAVGRLSVTL